MIDRWNHRRVQAGLSAWDPDTVYHLRGVPDEPIDIDIDTSAVAPLVRRAMQEHRTQWNDMNNPEVDRGAAGQERVPGDRGDRLAADPAGPGARRRLRGPLTAGSAGVSGQPAEHDLEELLRLPPVNVVSRRNLHQLTPRDAPGDRFQHLRGHRAVRTAADQQRSR